MAFERVCRVDEVANDRAFAATLDGVDVAVARQGDELYALQDLCSHGHVALSEGDVDDCTIECWLHGSVFDLRSGKPLSPPASEPVSTFPVEVRDGEVYVDVASPLNGVTPY